MINPFLALVLTLLKLYYWVLIAYVILSLLISFNVVNRYQPLVARIWDVLTRLTEPALRPIRRVVPTIGGIDLAPLVLILALGFLQNLLVYYFA